MLISVIIPTCNRNELLGRCLDLLTPVHQNLDNDIYEVIVTDDSKEQAAKSLVGEKYSWAKWIQGPMRGPAANRNNGAKNAGGEWLIFIDDDCLPDSKLLQQYKNAFERHPGDRAFEGSILPDDWELLKRDLSECPVNVEGDCFWSANICVNRSLFHQINGFNENYLIAAQEDQQMKIDIEKMTKNRIRFLKECIVIHPVRFTSFAGHLKKLPVASKNFAIYAFKNREVLHYNSMGAFAVEQLTFHSKNALRQLAAGKVRSALISIIWLCYGVPLNCLNLSKLKTFDRKGGFSVI